MQALLGKFFDYLRYEKQVADNTYQAYQRDIAQFQKYLLTYTTVQNFEQLKKIKNNFKSKDILL